MERDKKTGKLLRPDFTRKRFENPQEYLQSKEYEDALNQWEKSQNVGRTPVIVSLVLLVIWIISLATARKSATVFQASTRTP